MDEYIDKVISPLRLDNENFLEKLYKDMHYLLKDIDKKGENDLALENGEIVIDGHLILSGYQSR